MQSDSAGLTGRGGGDPATPGLASVEGKNASLSVVMDTSVVGQTGGTSLPRNTGAPRKGWLKAVGGGAAGSGSRPVGKIALIGVLTAVFVLVLVMVLGPTSSGKASQTPADADENPTIAIKTAEIPVWSIPDPYPAGLRDPMVLVEPPKPVEETPEVQKQELFVLKGVVLGAKGNTAIVGTEIVGVGDEIQGAKVIRIDRGEVEFEKDGQRWVQTVTP